MIPASIPKTLRALIVAFINELLVTDPSLVMDGIQSHTTGLGVTTISFEEDPRISLCLNIKGIDGANMNVPQLVMLYKKLEQSLAKVAPNMRLHSPEILSDVPSSPGSSTLQSGLRVNIGKKDKDVAFLPCLQEWRKSSKLECGELTGDQCYGF